MRLAYSLAIRSGSPDDEIIAATWDFEHCAAMLISRDFSASERASYITGVVSPVDAATAPTSGLH
jgi:hypothetical protein